LTFEAKFFTISEGNGYTKPSFSQENFGSVLI
jgi:hypothetical protein